MSPLNCNLRAAAGPGWGEDQGDEGCLSGGGVVDGGSGAAGDNSGGDCGEWAAERQKTRQRDSIAIPEFFCAFGKFLCGWYITEV